MQILNHQQQMQQQMASEKLQEPRILQRPPNMPNMANMPNTPNPSQPHQAMMAQSMADSSVQPQGQPNAAGSNMPPIREKIWSGVLEWFEKAKNTPADKVPHQVPCYVTAKESDPEMYVSHLTIKLINTILKKKN